MMNLMSDRSGKEQASETARGRADWMAGGSVVLGLAASALWGLFLGWLCYSAAIWILS